MPAPRTATIAMPLGGSSLLIASIALAAVVAVGTNCTVTETEWPCDSTKLPLPAVTLKGAASVPTLPCSTPGPWLETLNLLVAMCPMVRLPKLSVEGVLIRPAAAVPETDTLAAGCLGSLLVIATAPANAPGCVGEASTFTVHVWL